MNPAEIIKLADALDSANIPDEVKGRVMVRLPIAEWDHFRHALHLNICIEDLSFTSCIFHGIRVEVEL